MQIEKEWMETAARFQVMLVELEDENLKLPIVNGICKEIGGGSYPEFLKLLLLISQKGTDEAKVALSKLFETGIEVSEMPGGRLNMWGGSTQQEGFPVNRVISASTLLRARGSQVSSASLGPIEYILVWHGQKTHKPYLSDGAFSSALQMLLSLFNHWDRTSELYAKHLMLQADAGVEGAFTQCTKGRMRLLAELWLSNTEPEVISREVLLY